jgi:LuxR family maltose regulon positive regulatory protein
LSAPARVPSTLRFRPPSSLTPRVRRRRLEAALDRAFDTALTLVSAGPGFGKTVTLASWVELRQVDHAFAWLTVDPTDDSPHALWSDVLAAIRASGAVPEGSALNEISPASVFGPREVDGMLSRFADLRHHLVLVLDDFHLIRNPEVLESFAVLLSHLPERLRLVLTTRADPLLPLHRLRVAGQLTEIRSRELAFTLDEAADLFALEGFELSADQVDHLHRRTEGWAAGLRLAAMSLDPTDLEKSISQVTGSDRAIAEYLIGEVLDRLDPADREFLLRTSAVDRLCADLADRLTDRTDGQRVLDDLRATNAFVTSLDGDDVWFTYHPLLRELLRHRLLLEHRDLVPELYRRAADWLAGHGAPIEAIRYSIRAGDWDGAGRMLLACIPKILSVEAPALAAAIEPMARRANEDPGPFELIAAAAFHVQRHDYSAMRQNTLDGRQYLDTAPAEVRPTIAVLLDLFEAAGARSTGDADLVAERCRAILQVLETTPRRAIPLAPHFRAIATTNLGVGLLWTGDLDAADIAFGESERQLADLGMELTLLNTKASQAVVDAMAGRYRRAERRAREALEVVERRGWSSETQGLALHLAMGMVCCARGQADLAVRAFARGLAVGTPQMDRMVRLGLAIGSVEAAVLRKDVAAALEADARVRAGLARTENAPVRLRRWAAMAGAQALLAAGLPAEAVDRLGEPADDRGFSTAWQRVWLARAQLELGSLPRVEDLLRPVIEPGWQYREPVVAARLILAIVAAKQHKDGLALSHLSTAVELARPEGIRRPFLQLGGRLAGVMRRYRVLDGEHSAFVAEFVDDLRDGVEEGRPVEPLTEREMVVLKYLPTMLKAGEIADDLFVSVNTVKAHLRSIYRKLGVSNRREAVEQARVQGLL